MGLLNKVICGIIFYLMANSVFANILFTFKQAVELAFKKNPQLQADIQKANAARGQFVQDSLFLNPSIILESENIGGSGQFSGFESAETTFSINQPIPLGGKRASQQKASYANYQATIGGIYRKKAEIYMLVGEAYIDLMYADEWFVVSKKLAQLNQKIVNQINKMKSGGEGVEIDLGLAKIQLGESKITQSLAYRDIKKKQAVLARIIGMNHIDSKRLTDRGLPHQMYTWNKIIQSLDNSAFIAEKKCQLEAKRASINAVKKDVWPTMELQLGGRHFADDNQNAMVVSAGSTIPVFDRNQGKIISAEADYTQTLAELRALRLELKQRLYADFLDMQQSHEESQQVKNQLLPLAKKTAERAKQGYQQGKYSYDDLNNAMQALYEEERHYQSAHAELDKAVIRISAHLGTSRLLESKMPASTVANIGYKD